MNMNFFGTALYFHVTLPNLFISQPVATGSVSLQRWTQPSFSIIQRWTVERQSLRCVNCLMVYGILCNNDGAHNGTKIRTKIFVTQSARSLESRFIQGIESQCQLSIDVTLQ